MIYFNKSEKLFYKRKRTEAINIKVMPPNITPKVGQAKPASGS